MLKAAWSARTLKAAAAIAALVATALVVSAHRAGAASPSIAPPGGSYRAVSPTRVLDTRSGLGGTGPTTGVNLVVTGKALIPPSGVSAVAVNLTVTQPSTSGFATAYATSSGRSGTSISNYVAHQTLAAMTIVPVDSTGSISVYSSAPAQLILDVQGYFTDTAHAGTAGLFTSVAARLMDTREAGGVALGSHGIASLQVTGRGGVPSSGVSAVVINTTVTAPTAATGYVTAYAGGQPQPATSTINFTAGETRANRAIVPVGADGKINFYNSAGTTQLVIDVNGYFSDDTPDASYYVPVAPERLVDTRKTVPSGWTGMPGSVATRAVTVDGLSYGYPAGPAPAVQNVAKPTSVWLTLTGVAPKRSGYLTAYPSTGTRPLISDVNLALGRTVANSGPVTIGSSGAVNVFSTFGDYLLLDISGYFASAPRVPTPTGLWQWGVVGYDPAYRVSPTSGIKAVVGGATFDVALRGDGTLVGWSRARMSSGRLTAPPNLSSVSTIPTIGLAGSATTYALRSDHTVTAWGDDAYGEFGDGSRRDGVTTGYGSGEIIPQTGRVQISDVAVVGAATNNGYAVKSDGTVWAWGQGGAGQLGNGGTTDSFVPVRVTGLTGVKSIAGGSSLTYAVDNDGQLWRWGRLLTFPGSTAQTTPEKITGACATGVVVVANSLGGWELCDDGTVWQLDYTGRTSDNGASYFGQIPSLDRVTAISSASGPFQDGAGRGVQALRDDGTVWRLDGTTHQFRAVYGLNAMTGIGGSADVSYAFG